MPQICLRSMQVGAAKTSRNLPVRVNLFHKDGRNRRRRGVSRSCGLLRDRGAGRDGSGSSGRRLRQGRYCLPL